MNNHNPIVQSARLSYLLRWGSCLLLLGFGNKMVQAQNSSNAPTIENSNIALVLVTNNPTSVSITNVAGKITVTNEVQTNAATISLSSNEVAVKEVLVTTDDVIPTGYAVERYESLWKRSPFTLASVIQTNETFAQNLVIVGVLRKNTNYFITLLDKQTQQRYFLSDSNLDPKAIYKLVSVKIGEPFSQTTATIQKGGEISVIKFDDSLPMSSPMQAISGIVPGTVPVPPISPQGSPLRNMPGELERKMPEDIRKEMMKRREEMLRRSGGGPRPPVPGAAVRRDAVVPGKPPEEMEEEENP